MTESQRERLALCRVGIAGVGGLGSHVAAALARAGVGQLVIADYDRVETANLERQYYFAGQVGELKVVALARNLKQIDPGVRVSARAIRIRPDNLVAVFAGVEVLVEAFDRVAEKVMLVSNFRRFFPGVPLVAASGAAGIGPAATIETRRVTENLYLCGDEVSGVSEERRLEAPRVGIVAHHQALAVVRLLNGLEPA